PAFSSLVAGEYQDLSYAEAGLQVRRLAIALKEKLGLERGDRASIISFNRYEWALADLALGSLGVVTAPVYPNLPAELAAKVLRDATPVVVVVEDDEQLEKILSVRESLPELKWIVQLPGSTSRAEEDIFQLDDLLATGEQLLPQDPGFPDEIVKTLELDDVHTLVYTSGTTGDQKGVMLTHRNILSNIEDLAQVVSITHDDVLLSFLPLSHSYERTAGYYLPLYHGAKIAYAENMLTVGDNMGQVSPTVMTAVPRFFEKMRARVIDNVNQGPPLKRRIFYWALKIGGKRFAELEQGSVSTWTAFRFRLAERLVFKKISDRLGGRLRFFVSGAAPLDRKLGEFFFSAGVLILEGYGITETSPVITCNTPQKFKFGTVGMPIPSVEVIIADDGEILTRGPNLMKGYYNRPDDTAAVIVDGWYHTGDIGFVGSDGMLRITDRKKNLIVTSGGKNVAPQPIEILLAQSPLIEQVLLVGDRRHFISAMIVPNFEKLEEAARVKDLRFHSTQELVELPEVYRIVQAEVDRLTVDLGRYERPRRIALLGREFSIEEGEMTPSLKIKRGFVLEKYSQMIEEIYRDTEGEDGGH
ncbi:long-chain fatty acid--CoA ligase, partial [bacterium]|nr:long-chain fatty acid--CoA ligase [bacterium]